MCALLGLVTCVGGIANANDLFNGNLDLIGTILIQPDGNPGQNNPCPVGWNVEATKGLAAFYDGGDSETFCNIADPGGNGFFFKPFQGNVSNTLSCSLFQDNPSSPGTKVTFSAYVSCEANYSGLFTTNSPAPKTQFFVEFIDGGGNGLVTNVLDLITNGVPAGLPTGGPASMAQLTTPQYTAPASTATVRAGVRILNTYGTTGAQSFFADVLDLESVAPPGSPVITNQPVATTAPPGGNASFTVGVSNTTGASYQWQLYGSNINNGGEYSGATSATLMITGASAVDVGHYRVRVSNSLGSVFSAQAPFALVGFNFYPVVPIYGKIGDTYEVDYTTTLSPPTWIPFSTNTLTTSPQYVIDPTSPGSNSRFYRAVFLH